MGNTMALGQLLPTGVFDPQPDPATLPRNLVAAGMYIASSAISSALRPPPHFVATLGIYFQYVIALALVALLGFGMVMVGWMVSDAPNTHSDLGRTALRASHIVLVFAIALHEFASASTTEVNSATNAK